MEKRAKSKRGKCALLIVYRIWEFERSCRSRFEAASKPVQSRSKFESKFEIEGRTLSDHRGNDENWSESLQSPPISVELLRNLKIATMDLMVDTTQVATTIIDNLGFDTSVRDGGGFEDVLSFDSSFDSSFFFNNIESVPPYLPSSIHHNITIHVIHLRAFCHVRRNRI
jgi:hypothetical protein